MSIKRLNRSGPISFTQIATNSPYSAINNMLANVDIVVPTQNISVSASLARLKAFTGDSIQGIKTDFGIGVGLINYDYSKNVKLSEFCGGNYLSASVKKLLSPYLGVCHTQVYSDSAVYNSNYLTQETSSRVYRYSLYSKPTDLSTGFQKQHSYANVNDSVQYFQNLVHDRIYKVVISDVASNAFTSSFFTGSCNRSSNAVDASTVFTSTVTSNIVGAQNDIISQIAAISRTDTTWLKQKNELINGEYGIIKRLPGFVLNPNQYPLVGYGRSYIQYISGVGNRTFTFRGFIANLTPSGRYYSGLVTCSGGKNITLWPAVPQPPYEYAIDEVITTAGQASIKIVVLAQESYRSTGFHINTCDNSPSTIVNNVGVTQNCFYSAQSSNGLTNPLDVRFTGSVLISNPIQNASAMTVTPNDDWINLENGLPIDGTQLNPTWSPPTVIINAGTSGKISFAFGSGLWGNPLQSSSFSAMGTYTSNFGTGHITATMDKNVCLVSTTGLGVGNGGCPAAWQLMETKERGIIPASEIKVGMHLRDSDDGVWNVVTTAYLSNAPIWRTVIDGDTFDVDESHLWYIGNGAWKSVKTLSAGDMVESSTGTKLIVESNSLYKEDGEYMHLNCHNYRFLMGGKVIGHNSNTHTIQKF